LLKAKKFYNQIIGFKITNEEMHNAIFLSDKNYHHHLAINSWHKSNEVFRDYPQMKSFTLRYPTCEKYLHTINNLDKANITYKETSEGIFIKNIENTEILLKI